MHQQNLTSYGHIIEYQITQRRTIQQNQKPVVSIQKQETKAKHEGDKEKENYVKPSYAISSVGLNEQTGSLT